MTSKHKNNTLREQKVNSCDGACENRALIESIIKELEKYKKILGLDDESIR